ncbi:MAG: NAD-binding protein [Actinomycetota bacterium]
MTIERGISLASMASRLFQESTFIELFEHALTYYEPEIGAAVADVLKAEGSALHTGVSAQSIRAIADGVASSSAMDAPFRLSGSWSPRAGDRICLTSASRT